MHALNESELKRALVITAHPDDVDFGAAGTIATWVAEGIEVSYCICTNGDAGGFDPSVPRHEIPHIRQNEQRAAAEILGVSDVRFLGYPDGRLFPTIDLRRDISRVIRDVRPQRVLAQTSEMNYERIPASHPDHRAAGEAAFCAVYPDARNPFAHAELMQEGWDAWAVSEMWIMASNKPNTYIDISARFEQKLAALRAHKSQTEHVGNLEELIMTMSKRNASKFDLPHDCIAEVFQVVDTH